MPLSETLCKILEGRGTRRLQMIARTLRLWGRLALVSAGWKLTFLLKAGAVEDTGFRSDPW